MIQPVRANVWQVAGHVSTCPFMFFGGLPMKPFPLLIFLISWSPLLVAQEVPLPYATGSVDAFLKNNVAHQKPSIVLYNFNLESG